MKITDMQMSALIEAGNIGSGHAAIALSQLMDRKIMIDVPMIEFTKFDRMSVIPGNGHKSYVHVAVSVYSDIRGAMIFVIEEKMALKLCDILMSGKKATGNAMGELEMSALKEIGSILSISYLNAVSEMTSLSMIASVPELTVGGLDDIPKMSSLKDFKAEDIEDVLCIKTEFLEESNKIDAYQFFVSTEDDTMKIISSLGV